MIPAGLQQGEVEFGWIGGAGYFLENGVLKSIDVIPEDRKAFIDTQMNPKHQKALDEMGITNRDERRIKFLQCNSSSFDFTPDIKDGKMQLEYVACPFRGSCPQEGSLCQPLVINGQKLTMSLLRVISEIRKGNYDKEICSSLNIAPQTLRTQKQQIERKLNADRKTQVALKAVEYGII